MGMLKRAGRGQQFKRGIRKLFYRNEIFFLLAVLFLIGVLLGACLIRANGDSWKEFIRQMVAGFSDGRSTQSPWFAWFCYSEAWDTAWLPAVFTAYMGSAEWAMWRCSCCQTVFWLQWFCCGRGKAPSGFLPACTGRLKDRGKWLLALTVWSFLFWLHACW